MLFSVGLASVAGTVFVLYATIVGPVVPGALGHILVASMLSLPAAILLARIMIPDTDPPTDADALPHLEYTSSMDAIARGTEDGLKMWLNIVAMLLVIVALVALADIILHALPVVGGAPLTVERIFGWVFAPFVWLLGIPWDQAATAGSLMGEKTVLNEFIAYLHLAALPKGALDPRSSLIMLYALCGFANFGSVGIMIASISSLVPERRQEIVTPGAARAGLRHPGQRHDRRGDRPVADQLMMPAPPLTSPPSVITRLVRVTHLNGEKWVGPDKPGHDGRRNGRITARIPSPAIHTSAAARRNHR